MSAASEAQEPQGALANWLRGQGSEIEQQRRVWVQPSLTAGLFLACLEEGPHGHVKTTFFGKADNPFDAIRGALDAWAAEGEGATLEDTLPKEQE